MASESASKGTAVVVTSVVFLVLAALSVICRLIARLGYLKSAGSDDAAIVIALVRIFSTFGVEIKTDTFFLAYMHCSHRRNLFP